MVDERSAEPLQRRAVAELAEGEELTEDELVDEMELESFPASDPPSTWAGPSAA